MLDKAILDRKYEITQEEFDSMTKLEQELYISPHIYLMKQPEIVERLTCGLCIRQSVYKVFNKFSY